MEKKINPFREFLNIAGDIYDMAELAEDGSIHTWKSDDLLELFRKFYEWSNEYGEPIILKEDEYDRLTAQNQALRNMVDAFGLELE